MTNEDWKYVEDRLSNPFGSVKLLVDGYNVTLVCQPEKPLHYVISVFIDGKFQAGWVMEDCDIRRRFCSRHTKCYLDQKARNLLKREEKSVREEVKKRATTEYYMPFWNSFRLMKSHFIKNNVSIELAEKRD